jgi:hypothetical protein
MDAEPAGLTGESGSVAVGSDDSAAATDDIDPLAGGLSVEGGSGVDDALAEALPPGAAALPLELAALSAGDEAVSAEFAAGVSVLF